MSEWAESDFPAQKDKSYSTVVFCVANVAVPRVWRPHLSLCRGSERASEVAQGAKQDEEDEEREGTR